MRALGTLLGLVWALAGCSGDAEAQVRMFDRQEFAPTAFYEAIYEMMEECSGVEGDFEHVRWYTAQIILAGPTLSIQWIGSWRKTPEMEHAEITFDREFAFDGALVSHEILHDLYDGPAPMDVAHRCVLDWSRLTRVRRANE